MMALVQRVARAHVEIAGATVGATDAGGRPLPAKYKTTVTEAAERKSGQKADTTEEGES